MRKTIVVLLLLALLCACIPAMAEGKPLKILIVTSSGVDDGNFNQDCYNGIQAFLADHADCSVKDVKEPDLAELIPTVERLV